MATYLRCFTIVAKIGAKSDNSFSCIKRAVYSNLTKQYCQVNDPNSCIYVSKVDDPNSIIIEKSRGGLKLQTWVTVSLVHALCSCLPIYSIYQLLNDIVVIR